jgi:hypothetical protein
MSVRDYEGYRLTTSPSPAPELRPTRDPRLNTIRIVPHGCFRCEDNFYFCRPVPGRPCNRCAFHRYLCSSEDQYWRECGCYAPVSRLLIVFSSGDLDEARALTDRRRRRMRVSNPYRPPPRVEARVDGSVSPLGAEVDRGVEAPTTGRPARSEADWSGYRVPRGDDGDGLSTPIRHRIPGEDFDLVWRPFRVPIPRLAFNEFGFATVPDSNRK